MKRAKDKYMINRTKYKDIKRYDHKQMEDFLTDVYKNGYADGKEESRWTSQEFTNTQTYTWKHT